MSASPTETGWLRAWRDGSLPPAEALARFDACAGVEPDELLGTWRGAGLPTGHPLDGLLESLGWYGKRFDAPDRVHPLLFSGAAGPQPLDPAYLPAGLAIRLPGLARLGPARAAFRAMWPLLRARRPGARLERRAFRGRASTAMVYLRQPVTDHFRRAPSGEIIGCMELRGMAQPFFFLLERET